MLFSVSTRLMKKGTRASVSSVLCGNRRVLEPARLERRLGEDAKRYSNRRQPTIQSQRIYRTSFKRRRTNSEFPLTLSTFYERHLRHCRTIESATAPAQFTEDPRPSRDCSRTASCRLKCPPADTSRPRANLFFFCYKFFDLITQRENP